MSLQAIHINEQSTVLKQENHWNPFKDGNIDPESEEMEAYKYTFRNCRQWTSAINLYRGAFTNKSKDFWADPATKQKIRNIKVRDAVRSFGNIYQVSTYHFKAKVPFLDIFGTHCTMMTQMVIYLLSFYLLATYQPFAPS